MSTQTAAKRERDILPLFELPPRKRFKVLEQQREERKVEGGTNFPTKHGGDHDPHCSDITNSIRLSPKKLVAKGFKVLEKLKQKQRRQEESLVRAMLPPLPHAGAKHKEVHKVAHQRVGGGDKVRPEAGYGAKKEKERLKVRTQLKHDGPALVCTLSKSAGMSPREDLKIHRSESAREIQVGSSTVRFGETVLHESAAVKQSSSTRHHHHHHKDRKDKPRQKRPLHESRGLGVLPGVVEMAKGLLGAVDKTEVLSVSLCGKGAPESNGEQQRYVPSERICKSLLRSEIMDMEATELEMAEVLKSISENPVSLTLKSPTTSVLETPNETLSYACATEGGQVEDYSEVRPLNETQMTQHLGQFDASPCLQTLEEQVEHEATLPMDIDNVVATIHVVVSTEPLIAETVDQLRVATEHSSKEEMQPEDDKGVNLLFTQETCSNFELNTPSYPVSNGDDLNVQIIGSCNGSEFPHTESATIEQQVQESQVVSLNLETEDVKDDSGVGELTQEQESCNSPLLSLDVVVLPMHALETHLLAEEATMSSALDDSGMIAPALEESISTLLETDAVSPQEKLGDDGGFVEHQQAVGDPLTMETAMEVEKEMEKVVVINLGGLGPVMRGESDVVSQEKPQTILTKRAKLLAEIDDCADKIFKRMFEREGSSEWDDHDGHFLPDNVEDDAVEVDEDPVQEMEMEMDASLSSATAEESPKNDNGDGEVAGQEANTVKSASPVSIFLGDQSLPLKVMTNRSTANGDGRPHMLQGLNVICQDCPEVQVENTSSSCLGLKNDAIEGPGNLVCRSSKEDSNWDEDQEDEVPDFVFGKRSGITQRIKAPGRPFQVLNVEPESVTDEEDDGCDICQSSDAEPADPIVYCDGCDVAVHANCYGNPLRIGVPEGDWFCAQCKSGNPESRTCCLCPMTKGAMKQTTDGKWAHISCAVFVPEVFFRSAVGREPIDTSHVPHRRWVSVCSICKSTGGACVDCTEIACKSSFHVSCALKKDLAMEYRNGRGGAIVISFCEAHTARWNQQQESKERSKYKIVAREKWESKECKVPRKSKML